ncbi:hypothetical protein SL040_000503 [Aeromonas salmonicida]|jgi:hypothetical protein|uniref:Uncharacterized protein n=1 Tax=Aeromonas phage vB_AsaM_LPM4 TaxID=2894367 RepID=A0AAE8YH23_9CAUD|nr:MULTISPECIES: hypothetical protein [Aeromonas]YP_010664486.1 hypothetical protein PQA71_gp44 [Aeromonas phage vB_AsaM_LPM4]ELY1969291.1 hypothetical protein [Aeromonas salmonicida]ELY2000741.1 hypothetical protein [Aeromonas salmonicida]MCR4453791.1 hypothetical protein [Aeromonas salmonicida]UGC97301.1 hypothetical protein [Aeromonas phage vB_AsaM_LPM4]
MIAITAKHTAANPTAAVAYLVRHGYINVKNSWLRGQRHAARIELLPSGRARVLEGVAA